MHITTTGRTIIASSQPCFETAITESVITISSAWLYKTNKIKNINNINNNCKVN